MSDEVSNASPSLNQESFGGERPQGISESQWRRMQAFRRRFSVPVSADVPPQSSSEVDDTPLNNDVSDQLQEPVTVSRTSVRTGNSSLVRRRRLLLANLNYARGLNEMRQTYEYAIQRTQDHMRTLNETLLAMDGSRITISPMDSAPISGSRNRESIALRDSERSRTRETTPQEPAQDARTLMPPPEVPRERLRISTQPNEDELPFWQRYQGYSMLTPTNQRDRSQERHLETEASQALTTDGIEVDASTSAARSPVAPEDVEPLIGINANEPNGVVERSATARRDLERALRDYRSARRALRNHYNTDQNSPADRSSPTYQGVLAQLAEQGDHNRNRMRARGQSRSNALDRTDAVVDRIAATAGISDDAWRSDDDGRTVVSASTHRAVTASTQSNGSTALPAGRPWRRLVPWDPNTGSDIVPTSESVIRGVNSTSGGMRDFHRRAEDSDSYTARTGTQSSLRFLEENRPNMITPNGNTIRAPRTNNNQNRPNNNLPELRTNRGNSPSVNASKSRARKTIKYLSDLKNLKNIVEEGRALAKSLGIDNIHDSIEKDLIVDLPFHIDALPSPQYSCWLEGGTSWSGLQKGGFGKHETDFSSFVSSITSGTSGPLFSNSTNNTNNDGESGNRNGSVEDQLLRMRAWRHRERIRADRQQDNENTQLVSLPRPQNETSGVLGGLSGQLDALADMEQHLSEMLQVEERRLNRGSNDEWRISGLTFQPRLANTTIVPPRRVEDKWPVKVTIHHVDWKSMTLTGTMVASQIPDPARGHAPVAPRDAQQTTDNVDDKRDQASTGSYMETFFDGEIIDFRTHELETVTEKEGYKVGGILTDLKYWARIGPFKQEVAKRTTLVQEQKAAEMYHRLGFSGSLADQRKAYMATFDENPVVAEDMDRDESAEVMYNVMSDCLGSASWMKKAMGESGWIFMRWKERCFMSPPATRPSTSSGEDPNSPATSSNRNAASGAVPTASNETSSETRNPSREVYHPSNGNYRMRTLVHRPSPTSQQYTTTYTDERRHSQGGSWGLTIQGFYYVALHRQTGRIEALYYDSGSQPFQELTCHPVAVEVEMLDRGLTLEDMAELGDIIGEGVKKEFGSWEFR